MALSIPSLPPEWLSLAPSVGLLFMIGSYDLLAGLGCGYVRRLRLCRLFLRGCPVGRLCEPLAGGAVASIRPPVASSRPVPSRLVFSLFPRLVNVVCVEGDPAGRVGLYREAL